MVVAIWGLCVVGCDVPNTDEPAVEQSSEALTTQTYSHVDYGGTCRGGGVSYHTCWVTDSVGLNERSMHCCGPGEGMQGIFAATDTLYCRGVPYDQGWGGSEGINNSYSTRSKCVWRSQLRTVNNKTMLGCNSGEYMIGIHQQANMVACCPVRQPVAERVDGDGDPGEPHLTTNYYQVDHHWYDGQWKCPGWARLHTCGDASGPNTELMVGLHVNNEWLLCAN